MKLSRLLAASALALLLPDPGASAGEPATFLPFMGPRLEAARYSPADADFAWVGWIGARVDLVEKGRWAAYFNPDVETILGHRVRSFEAVQANYSLELGARRQVGRGLLGGFFHHVSRHVQDRDKRQAIDWNFLGVRYESPWPRNWNRRGGFSGSVGVATLSSGVKYGFETRLSGDVDVVRAARRSVFLLADVRLVNAEASLAFPRDSFADARAEVGLRRFQDRSEFALFVAWEHRNDALVPAPLVTDRALFGFRIQGLNPQKSGPTWRP